MCKTPVDVFSRQGNGCFSGGEVFCHLIIQQVDIITGIAAAVFFFEENQLRLAVPQTLAGGVICWALGHDTCATTNEAGSQISLRRRKTYFASSDARHRKALHVPHADLPYRTLPWLWLGTGVSRIGVENTGRVFEGASYAMLVLDCSALYSVLSKKLKDQFQRMLKRC